MKQYKNVAIIGCRGMVGSDLVTNLKPYFQTITGIDRKNYDTYVGEHFDVVINANGNSSKVWAGENVLGDFEASTVSIYKTLFDFPCNTYLYISSADVYEDHTSKKTTIESKTIRPENLSQYGFHKYLSECIIRNFTKNYIILRCPMMLGTKLKKGPYMTCCTTHDYSYQRNLPSKLSRQKNLLTLFIFSSIKTSLKKYLM